MPFTRCIAICYPANEDRLGYFGVVAIFLKSFQSQVLRFRICLRA